MNTFKWISEGIKSLRISRSIAGSQGVQARSFGSAAPEPLPPKPKKPLNPFFKYRFAARSDVIKQHPGLSGAEINRVLGEKWRQLPESEKELYFTDYETEMSNYVKEMAKYHKISLTTEQVQQVLLERNLSLKRQILRQEFQDDLKNVNEQLAQKWKTLSEQEKEPYVKAWQAEKEAYEKFLTTLGQETIMQMGQQDVVREDTMVTANANRKSK